MDIAHMLKREGVVTGGGRSRTLDMYDIHPESVFLCLGCRLGGFVPLSGFFHGFVGYFYQSSRTNVDSLWYKRIDISSRRLVKVTHKSVKEPRKWNKTPSLQPRHRKTLSG